jgi:hypothetical protein
MRNGAAKLTSVRGLARRFDRVFSRGLSARSASLLATADISPAAYGNATKSLSLCPSDHYALNVVLADTPGFAAAALQSLGSTKYKK